MAKNFLRVQSMSEYWSFVKNPRWADAEQTVIVCEVNFSHLPEDFVSFAANPKDSEAHSKEIFERCIRGDFGDIGAYVAPPRPSYEAMRLQAYRDEADPLFFKSQRGEATHEEWLAKVAEIKTRWPE